MPDQKTFFNCRRAMGVSYGDVMQMARSRHIDISKLDDVFAEEITRDEAIKGLRSCGMSLKDIGTILGLTRERIRQILVDQGMELVDIAEKQKPSAKSIQPSYLLKYLCTTPHVWASTGKLMITKVIEKFAADGYSEQDVRSAIELMRAQDQGAKARLLLRYWTGVDDADHYDWVTKQLRKMPESQLLSGLSNNQPVTVSNMAFNRYTRSIGVKHDPAAHGIRRSVGSDESDWEWLKTSR